MGRDLTPVGAVPADAGAADAAAAAAASPPAQRIRNNRNSQNTSSTGKIRCRVVLPICGVRHMHVGCGAAPRSAADLLRWFGSDPASQPPS